tara:strand:+ start:208 stop:483 length:276 start_codon:yes stop_codon:yes gene_type:complete
MCIFSRPSPPPAPAPLPPAPPPPLPPTPTAPPPQPMASRDVNPQVRRAKDDRGNKEKNQYSRGTGSLRIKLLDPKVNTGMGDETTGTGGLN